MIVYHQFNARCLLDVNYPPARHRDGTHIPVEYALHSWFFLSDMATHETTQSAVGCAGKANVATCFTVLRMGTLDDANATRKKAW